ncbi:hypothetical protein B0H13DRAFT_2310405 [Mycena leptocephala]|nr:hypothetical protein B0H13DRAFT_2310405 [Mycena leptocephala]
MGFFTTVPGLFFVRVILLTRAGIFDSRSPDGNFAVWAIYPYMSNFPTIEASTFRQPSALGLSLFSSDKYECHLCFLDSYEAVLVPFRDGLASSFESELVATARPLLLSRY